METDNLPDGAAGYEKDVRPENKRKRPLGGNGEGMAVKAIPLPTLKDTREVIIRKIRFAIDYTWNLIYIDLFIIYYVRII